MGCNLSRVNSTFQTVDATTVTFGAFEVPADSTAGLDLFLFARATDGTSSFWTITAAVKRVGSGTAAVVGTSTLIKTADAGASGWAIVIGAVNNSINLTVAGQAAVTINWGLFGDVYLFSQ